MKTPHLNYTIKYLEEFIACEDKDSIYPDIDPTKEKLEEYKAIKQALSIHDVSQREFKVGDFVWFNGEIWQINELYKEEKGAEVKKVNSTETRYPNLDNISHFS